MYVTELGRDLYWRNNPPPAPSSPHSAFSTLFLVQTEDAQIQHKQWRNIPKPFFLF